MAYGNEDISFEIIEHIADLSEPTDKGWVTELNIVSWNGREPKYDIRNWNEDHTRCSKVSTFNEDGIKLLIKVMSEIDIDSLPKLK